MYDAWSDFMTFHGAHDFRRELIERLALTEHARVGAMHGRLAEMATELGVTEATLAAAARLARAGFAPMPEPGPGRSRVEVFIAPAVARPLLVLARQRYGWRRTSGAGYLARSVMHAVMQTEREPTVRARGNWEPLEGCDLARYRLTAQGAPRSKEVHVCVHFSRGLDEAVRLRAMAFGCGRARYVNLWLADLVDGRLADLPIPPVESGQLFESARAYVLPVLTVKPDGLAELSKTG